MSNTDGASPQDMYSQSLMGGKRLRRRIKQIERLFRLGCFELDLADGSSTWSAGAYAIFEIPNNSPIATNEVFSFCAVADQVRILSHFENAKTSGEPFDLIVPFRIRSRKQGWLQICAQVETVGGSKRLSGFVRDITIERDTEASLRALAHRDVLTGLPNRRAVEDLIKRAKSQLAKTFAFCIVDVDKFKTVNDLYGHDAGDKLLQAVAVRLIGAIRSGDIVARLGGDEFAVILNNVDDDTDLLSFTTSIVEAIRAPVIYAKHTVRSSISVGATLAKGHAKTFDKLLRQADFALYKAKANGRDQACVYKSHLRNEGIDRNRLVEEVRSGLACDQFEVHYQPIVDLRTRIVRGWEALIRWQHPIKGMLLPGQFPQAFSDPAVSGAVDDFVLETSLWQMRQWLNCEVPVTCVCVNVSDKQLKRHDLVERIGFILEKYHLTPDRLKIEILETALIGHDADVVATTIRRLARFGVVSALDDFGTGYASLSHLKQFKVERIKIDRSFVEHVESNPYDQAIIRCIINLGRDLGIRITAEGIETVEQLSILRQWGCDVGQGILFARPMHPDDVPNFLSLWYERNAALLFLQQEESEERVHLRACHERRIGRR